MILGSLIVFVIGDWLTKLVNSALVCVHLASVNERQIKWYEAIQKSVLVGFLDSFGMK